MADLEKAKKAAALKAVDAVQSGMTIGLGTGTTAHYAIEAIGELMKKGYELKAVASSIRSEQLAASFGIPIVPFTDDLSIDLYLDGADEIDRAGNLIKGGGGALVREKILASGSRLFVVMADETKLVERLGAFALPVEVIPFAWRLTARKLQALGAQTALRYKDGNLFQSDNGNYIIDCRFAEGMEEPVRLNAAINALPGVVESGLFGQAMVGRIVIGHSSGAVAVLR